MDVFVLQRRYSLLLLLGFALIVALCEFLHKKGLHVEYTRKLAHCFACLLSLLIPVFFNSGYYVSGLVIITFSALFIAYRKKVITSVNGVNRKTCGAYLLPVSIGTTYYLSEYLQNDLFFTLPIIILAISDPLANCVGKRYKSKKLKSGKTAIGILTFFLSTFILCCLTLYYKSIDMNVIATSFGVSIVTSKVELVSPNGSDNITIPFSVIASLVLFDLVL